MLLLLLALLPPAALFVGLVVLSFFTEPARRHSQAARNAAHLHRVWWPAG